MKTMRSLALGVLIAWGGAARAEGAANAAEGRSLRLEVESQVPCFFFGGYQVAVGARQGRLRLRAGTIDSGRFDVEPLGIGNRKDRFERSFDDGSFRLYADWFVLGGWYVGALVATHRWRVESEATGTSAHLRTLDGGVGTGFQWMVYRGVFVQPVFHVFFRERRRLAVGAEEYRIPEVELNAAIRAGVSW